MSVHCTLRKIQNFFPVFMQLDSKGLTQFRLLHDHVLPFNMGLNDRESINHGLTKNSQNY
jgi:hypothetical protein